MAKRPYWKGQIRLSLVTLPVEMYSAVNNARYIPLHQIYKKTGERIHHKNVAGEKEVEAEDIVKGFEYEKGEYVLLDPEEIKELKIPSSKTLDIVQFVSADEIDPMYFEKPYYLVPEKNGEEAFSIIRDALRESKKVGLGQLVIAGRERLVSIKPCGSGMLLETMRYREEIRKSDPFFDDIKTHKVGKEEVSLAQELIKKKTKPFEPEKFVDHYREALQELIDARIENREPNIEEEKPVKTNVVNLMDALKKSLGSSDSDAEEDDEEEDDDKKSKSKKKTAKKAKPKPKKKAKAHKKTKKAA